MPYWISVTINAFVGVDPEQPFLLARLTRVKHGTTTARSSQFCSVRRSQDQDSPSKRPKLVSWTPNRLSRLPTQLE